MTEAEALERLEAMRAELDHIDADLVALLGRRFGMIRDVAEHKRLTGIAVMQPSRVVDVFATRLQRAREAGLDPKLVERLWTTIITHACQIENEVGGIEGGQMLFQGVSLDHARIEVEDLDAACEMICARLSFDRVKGGEGKGEGRGAAAILKGGDVTLLVTERGAEPDAGPTIRPATCPVTRPADLAIQVHRLAPTVSELRRRGNAVEVRREAGSGIRTATVHLGHPAHLTVRYVERAPGASPLPADLDGPVSDSPLDGPPARMPGGMA